MGSEGTYREAMFKMGAKRIVCHLCGFCKEVPPDDSYAYELWYAMNFKGRRLWANNRRHLAFLISWLAGRRSRVGVSAQDRAYVEALPKWMILAKNRSGILKCLKKLIAKDDVAANQGGHSSAGAGQRRAG
jgi:hypothetical protein